jgi:His-Xaa-Ser system radical SAM maturase HxsC
MLLRVKGTSSNIDEPIVGKITRDINVLNENSLLICENEVPSVSGKKLAGILTSLDFRDLINIPIITNIPTFDHLSEGDLVVANNDGNLNTLYRVNSHHNTLLATERCNSNCLMCSQPPKDKNDIYRLYNIHQKLIPLIPKDCIELGISGGEPTLLGDLFFKTLLTLKEHLPDTEIHVLTNGRSFAWPHFAEKLSHINYKRLMLGVPVYADYYQLHDYIVQARNAFDQTILGLHNLASYDQRIEIRVVLHKQSIPRLPKLARYIYKNLPFAEHVAFMGLEYIGYTPYNIDQLWIDPHDYMDELSDAVEFLSGQGMFVSIYNSQLCVLPAHLWNYARRSISDWKTSYLPECGKCAKLKDCGGLFTWNLNKHSKYIKPFGNE